ncbi:FkbM family methyltransferase [Algivirga pacifica]|uniref:Methyltransferase FkbM domain-containing protein n=1 Tax=Algivirga pacifica TaxID=1162670 RepID=A0ABP9DLC9_9BACT
MKSLLQSINLTYVKAKIEIAGWYFDQFTKEYKTENCTFHIPKELTTRTFRGNFPLGYYEKEERFYLKRYLPKDASVLELGGCIGVVSCTASKLLDDSRRHVVVEANPALIPWLKQNRDRNNLHFSIEHCLISESPLNDFYVNPSIVSSSNKKKVGEKIQVKGKTIQELEQHYQIQFDTLLMDIEGAEIHFLENNKSFLEQINLIMFEIHNFDGIMTDEEAKRCEELLSNAGLKKEVEEGYFQIWKRP